MAKSKRARTSSAEEADGAEEVIASQLKKKKPEPTKSESSKPHSPPSDYETGSETDSGSESDAAGQLHAANAKPNAAAKDPVLTRSKASATPATAAKKTKKKVAENEAEAVKEEKPKVTPFQREKDAWAEMDAFYELVKDRLSVSVTRSQLQEKLKRMKKKFKSMAKDSFRPKKGHELEAELMKKVWGGGAGHVKAGKAEGEVLGASLGVLSGIGGGFEGFKELGFSEAFLKKGMDLVDEEKRAELNARHNLQRLVIDVESLYLSTPRLTRAIQLHHASAFSQAVLLRRMIKLAASMIPKLDHLQRPATYNEESMWMTKFIDKPVDIT
ncbi:hypothetical protein ACLB2K_004376 [Fragaria x ananassa]